MSTGKKNTSKKATQSPAVLSEAGTVVGVAAVVRASTNHTAANHNAELEAAYQKLLIEHEQLKQAYDNIVHTTPDPRKLPAAGIPPETFEVNGSTYQMAAANLYVKGVGKRTALEALVDDQLHPSLGNSTILNWLVANNSTSIKKIS
jgi:hypothetical protein